MKNIKSYLENNYSNLNNEFCNNLYVNDLSLKNDQIYIIHDLEFDDIEKFIHDFCVYFHNKDMKFHCYEVLIITKCNVDYNRWFVEDFGIKFFNIISIDEINNSLSYRKPYYIQSKKFKKLINTIIKDSNYDIYKVGFKNKKKLIKNRYKNML